jgi:hypothetical protein
MTSDQLIICGVFLAAQFSTAGLILLVHWILSKQR